MANGETLSIGSCAYLVGHDGQPGDAARTTLTHGIISSFVEWDAAGITFIQTDAASNSGRKGAALVTENGRFIGFNGLSPSRTSLPLVTSSVDLLPIVQALIAGDFVSAIGDRRVRPEDGVKEHTGALANVAAKQGYAVLAPPGERVEIEVTGDNNLCLTLWGYFGGYVQHSNDTRTGTESLSFTVGPEGSALVLVEQASLKSGEFTLTSSHDVIPLIDFDDGKEIAVGETLLANLDNPAEHDYFLIDLEEGETVTITTDSMTFDSYVLARPPNVSTHSYVRNDDSGGGLFGLNPRLNYTASSSGQHIIIVIDVSHTRSGGYSLTVSAE